MLSERQEAMLRVVWERWAQGNKAGLREMHFAAGFAGTHGMGAVSYQLKRLEELGFVERRTMPQGSLLGRAQHFYTRGARLAGVDSKGRVGRVIDETRGWL